MGQANNRGSREQRVEEAKIRNAETDKQRANKLIVKDLQFNFGLDESYLAHLRESQNLSEEFTPCSYVIYLPKTQDFFLEVKFSSNSKDKTRSFTESPSTAKQYLDSSVALQDMHTFDYPAALCLVLQNNADQLFVTVITGNKKYVESVENPVQTEDDNPFDSVVARLYANEA